MSKIDDRLWYILSYVIEGNDKIEHTIGEIKKAFSDSYPSEDELTNVLKDIQFKDFIPTNGVRGKDRYITMHHKARQRIAKAIHKRIRGE